jgi:hypothetical protein
VAGVPTRLKVSGHLTKRTKPARRESIARSQPAGEEHW